MKYETTDINGTLRVEVYDPVEIKPAYPKPKQFYEKLLPHGEKTVIGHQHYAEKRWFEIEKTKHESKGFWIYLNWWVPYVMELDNETSSS